MTLKRVVDPETYANHLYEIKVAQRAKAEIIDATLSPEDHINELLDRRLKFGKDGYRAYNVEVERRAEIVEQKRSAAQTARDAEHDANNKSRNEPMARFTRAFNSLDPSALVEFQKSEPTETLASIFTEISANPRHYNSIFKFNVSTAMQALQNELGRRPAPKTSLTERIKASIGL